MTDPGQAFEPATGDGAGDTSPGRDAELRTAYEGLLQIRRLVNGPAGAAVPAPWELRQPSRAVALVLEAAGIPPSALDADGSRSRTGYRVTASGSGAGRVEVAWVGPPSGGAAAEEQERLKACAAVLEELGWVCLLYRGPRRRRFLEVEPPH
ncbi:hypothetical protein [Streptomyces sp. NRRL F-2664]|uniref:hypothetical protein n=1 Tax=Streptomyces sp. NRRL F-2664 TaxID=1463842 RepID=UPI0004C680BE|nr:hypothetical protein [Streptomyces sp. NRRL F-2664]